MKSLGRGLGERSCRTQQQYMITRIDNEDKPVCAVRARGQAIAIRRSGSQGDQTLAVLTVMYECVGVCTCM